MSKNQIVLQIAPKVLVHIIEFTTIDRLFYAYTLSSRLKKEPKKFINRYYLENDPQDPVQAVCKHLQTKPRQLQHGQLLLQQCAW
jgi:hypothetical protein